MNPAVPVDGTVHSHYNDPLRLTVFSSDDFFKLYDWFKNGKIANLNTFTFGMVSDSTAYIMMITDSTAFANFGIMLLNDIDEDEMFNSTFYDGFGIKEDKPMTDNEKRFLKAIQTLNTGLSLFKANSAITKFTKIQINANDQVKPAPCN